MSLARESSVSPRGWGERPWLVSFTEGGRRIGYARYRTSAKAYEEAARWEAGEDVPMEKLRG